MRRGHSCTPPCACRLPPVPHVFSQVPSWIWFRRRKSSCKDCTTLTLQIWRSPFCIRSTRARSWCLGRSPLPVEQVALSSGSQLTDAICEALVPTRVSSFMQSIPTRSRLELDYRHSRTGVALFTSFALWAGRRRRCPYRQDLTDAFGGEHFHKPSDLPNGRLGRRASYGGAERATS